MIEERSGHQSFWSGYASGNTAWQNQTQLAYSDFVHSLFYGRYIPVTTRSFHSCSSKVSATGESVTHKQKTRSYCKNTSRDFGDNVMRKRIHEIASFSFVDRRPTSADMAGWPGGIGCRVETDYIRKKSCLSRCLARRSIFSYRRFAPS